jgi:hypothetical protein
VSRGEAWLLHLAHLLVGGSGLVYALVRYLIHPDDPFAVAHPLQAPAQHAHVWSAPLLVFALGWVWKSHVWAGFRSGAPERRRSGLTMLAVAAPMVGSGYFLQTAAAPVWRSVWVGVHLASSLLALAAYLVHQVLPRRRA